MVTATLFFTATWLGPLADKVTFPFLSPSVYFLLPISLRVLTALPYSGLKNANILILNFDY